jgi:hypothetical protein
LQQDTSSVVNPCERFSSLFSQIARASIEENSSADRGKHGVVFSDLQELQLICRIELYVHGAPHALVFVELNLSHPTII